MKKWLALAVHRYTFDDDGLQEHTDPRVAAWVAGVPLAADFDMASLTAPARSAGLVTRNKTAGWCHVFTATGCCSVPVCEPHRRSADAGTGALLSPLSRALSGSKAELLNDPPGFDRRVMAQVDQKVVRILRQAHACAKGDGQVADKVCPLRNLRWIP